MTIDELKALLGLVELQVKISLCDFHDEECGDMIEELDFHVACFMKRFCDEQKKNVNVEKLDVEELDVATN